MYSAIPFGVSEVHDTIEWRQIVSWKYTNYQYGGVISMGYKAPMIFSYKNINAIADTNFHSLEDFLQQCLNRLCFFYHTVLSFI